MPVPILSNLLRASFGEMLRQIPIQDFIELKHVFFLGDFVGAELKQVGVEVLGIEQFEILFAQEFH